MERKRCQHAVKMQGLCLGMKQREGNSPARCLESDWDP